MGAGVTCVGCTCVCGVGVTVAGAVDADGLLLDGGAAGLGFGFFGGAFIAGTPTAELSAGTAAPALESATAGDRDGVGGAAGDDFLVADPTANAAPNATATASASAAHIRAVRAGDPVAAASPPNVTELM